MRTAPMNGKYKSMATIISLDQAVGTVLAHDITEIRPGEFKGASFKKGHIVKSEDLPHLRRLGKEHLFVLNLEPGEVHEDEAALKLAKALSGPGILFDRTPSEGKITLKAAHQGLLKVHVQALTDLCLIPEICCASRHTNTLVQKGEPVAATRAIPLIIKEKILEKAIRIAEAVGGIFAVTPLRRPRTGVVVTGNEVYKGLIEDRFASILKKKLEAFDCTVEEVHYTPDDRKVLTGHLMDLVGKGIELLMVSGGMSVDPDDISRLAIADAGAEDVVYGSSVLPGAMFLYGRIGTTTVLGLPACVLFHGTTILDVVLPRILAGEAITRKDLAGMAHGGLCLNCPECRYPLCPFGK